MKKQSVRKSAQSATNILIPASPLFAGPPESTQPLDDISRLASLVCQTGWAAVGVPRGSQLLFLACHGFSADHGLFSDPDFFSQTLSTGSLPPFHLMGNGSHPPPKFSAFVPIYTPQADHPAGLLAVFDPTPRSLSPEQREGLRVLARQAAPWLSHPAQSDKSQPDWRTVLEAAPYFIAVHQQGRMVYANPACMRQLEAKTPQELIGCPVLNFVHPDDHEMVITRMKQTLSGQAAPPVQERLVSLQGRVFEVEATATSILFDGTPSVLVMARDISQQTKALERVKKSESNLALAQSLAGLAFWEWDLETDTLTWSKESNQIFGQPPPMEEKPGRVFKKLIHADDWERIEGSFLKAIETCGTFGGTHKVNRSDGSVGFVKAKGEVIPGSHGKAVRVIGTVYDITPFKLVEDALRASEARLAQAQSMARLGSWVWNLKTNRLTWSTVVYDIFGIKPGDIDLTMENVFAMIPQEEHAGLIESQMRAVNERVVSQIQHKFHLPDGRVIHVVERGEAEFADDGTPLAINGTVYDVTPYIETQEALKQTEQTLLKAQKISHLGSWDWDILQGRVVWSEEAYRIYGLPPGMEISLAIFEQCIHPEDKDRVLNELKKCLENLSDFNLEHRVARPDGRVFHVSAQGEVTWSPEGKPVRMMGTVLDITTYKETEAALKKTEQNLLKAQQISHLGSWEWNFFQDTIELSEEARRICGLPPDIEVTMAVFEQCLHPEDKDRVLEGIRHSRETLGEYNLEHRLMRPDGEVRFVACHGEITFTPDGNPVSMMGTVLDITRRRLAEEERVKLEKQMESAQRLESLGLMAGGIAHDFNNMLVSILGLADLALFDLPEGSLPREHIHQLQTTAWQAAELTNQMLAYSGQGRFNITLLDLSQSVEEMIHLLKTVISKKALFTTRLTGGIPPIMADTSQIRQIILNLVINASEALEEAPGAVTVTAGEMFADRALLDTTYLNEHLQEGTYSFLQVEDTGCGMSPETVQKIFDPFFTTKFTGRGLGLAAVLGIIRGHQGAVKVTSRPGEGTTFLVMFPASLITPEPVGGESMSEQSPLMGNATILVVEDEESVRTVNRMALEKFGYTVIVAEDGREGVDVYNRCHQDIDLVLLDMTMPYLNGEEVLREIRLKNPQARVVLTSGYSESDSVGEMTKIGMTGFLPKPYRPTDLLRCIQEVLEKK